MTFLRYVICIIIAASTMKAAFSQDDPAFRVDQNIPKPSLIKSSGPSLGPQYEQDARVALGALQALKSVTRVGISYRDYPKRLQDCRIAVDVFLNRYPGNHKYKKPIRKAMDIYEDAMEVWSLKFAGTGGVENFAPTDELAGVFSRNSGLRTEAASINSKYGYHIDGVRSFLWSRGARQIDSLQATLR